MVLVLKNLPANAGDLRDTGLIPGLGRSPGEGNGNPLQYSCLENPMDRVWWATIHVVQRELVTVKAIKHNKIGESGDNDFIRDGELNMIQ